MNFKDADGPSVGKCRKNLQTDSLSEKFADPLLTVGKYPSAFYNFFVVQ